MELGSDQFSWTMSSDKLKSIYGGQICVKNVKNGA
jgi:hypothetical protein